MSGEQPSAAPQIQRRDAWFDVPEYPGFRVRLWTNYPYRLWQDVQSGETDRIEAALRAIVLEHNGWLDYDGQPYPSPESREFWDAIPTELAATLVQLIREAPYRLPNSLSSARRTSASSASG